ncbi:hypothetical protein J3A83DRAFT_4224445 [Scleroderma citrinum]
MVDHDIIDLVDEPPESFVEVPCRWNRFRSGTLDVSLFLQASSVVRNDTMTSTAEDDPRQDIRPERTADVHTRGNHNSSRDQEQRLVVDNDETLPQLDEIPLTMTFGLDSENFQLPLESHDKPRRILQAHDSALIAITMHGSIERIQEISSSKRRQTLALPVLPLEEHVDDACLLLAGDDTSIIMLAHAREDVQLMYLPVKGYHATRRRTLQRDWNKAKKGGVSALTTMMQPLKFASGGYDHRIHIWTMEDDLSDALPVELAIKHTSVIHSLLAIRDTSHKLISAGADRNIHLWDLSSERVAHSIKISNSPYHAHRTESPFCTLLEVAHLDSQFEVHDHRMVPNHPAHRFGFAAKDPQGRYAKGDTWSHFFVSGDRCGTVRLWDLRHISKEPYYVGVATY